MSIKRESLPTPGAQPVPCAADDGVGDLVELVWPNGDGVEIVFASNRRVEHGRRVATVDRIEYEESSHVDWDDLCIAVPEAWLREIKNA